MTEHPIARTWHAVSDRYAAQLAPPALHLTQAVANSFALTAQEVDPLDDLDTAREWGETLASEWTAIHGGSGPGAALAEGDLSRLQRLRSTVQGVLLGEPTATLRTVAEISLADGTLRLRPPTALAARSAAGSAGRWLESAVGAELLLAQQDDILRRLKLCRQPLCRAAFYDLSKNNSKVWHDVNSCGAPVRMREYRRRRQQTGEGQQPGGGPEQPGGGR